jgi:hypothetical protein
LKLIQQTFIDVLWMKEPLQVFYPPWFGKSLGSLELVSASHELLDFDRRPSEYLGVLPQFPISLGGKNVLVDVIVVQGPLDFNMLLGHDYLYAMNVVVSTLFWVMHFPHNGSIVTIDQLASDNHHPNSTLV